MSALELDPKQPRKRRGHVPVNEKLDEIDARIARLKATINRLEGTRAQLIAEHLAKAEAMKAEVRGHMAPPVAAEVTR